MLLRLGVGVGEINMKNKTSVSNQDVVVSVQHDSAVDMRFADRLPPIYSLLTTP